RDVYGERAVEPPGLDAGLERARPLRVEDLRGLRFGKIRRGRLEGAPGRDVDVDVVGRARGGVDKAIERRDAARELAAALAVVHDVRARRADLLLEDVELL